MKEIIGFFSKINELTEELILDLENLSNLRFETCHKQQLCFLFWRYGPDIVYDALIGIRISSIDEFIKRLREKCARLYQKLYEEKV